MTVGEMRRTPTADRVADVVLRRDEDREEDQDEDGELAVQSVAEAVAAAGASIADVGYRHEQLVHRPFSPTLAER